MDSKIDKKKVEQMKELKDMQLALYILFARRKYGDKKIESCLQTFKTKYEYAEFAKAATFEVGKEDEYMLYDDEFEQSLIAKIEEIKNSISEGDFHYDDSDEDQCKWCEFGLMCYQ
jgi:anti-sigma28 factor (negative regulator of flagellin synthesis)